MRTLSSVMGNSQRLDGGAMFGNAPRALWSRWATPDDAHRIPLACRALLVQEAGRNVLLETGIGAFFPPKLKDRFGVVEDEHVLLASLAERGLTHEDIDVVVLSHLHFDHAGGLLSPYTEGQAAQLLFPNARFVVGRAAWDRALHPHPRDRASFIPELHDLLEASGRLDLVDGDTHPTLGEGYRFHTSEGHTPGLLLTEIAMPEGPVVFAADLIPGAPWVHLPITMGYDRFPEQLIDEKRTLLEDLLARGGRLVFTHDPEVAMGTVRRDERGRFSVEDTRARLDGVAA
ncbi:MAG: MBL fold metallo-hydrolase [Deltaproteobacteria bacterium]|nr:MAG: MBL fold metallo-hydrolase [Deltaproteobacteria bacterium]